MDFPRDELEKELVEMLPDVPDEERFRDAVFHRRNLKKFGSPLFVQVKQRNLTITIFYSMLLRTESYFFFYSELDELQDQDYVLSLFPGSLYDGNSDYYEPAGHAIDSKIGYVKIIPPIPPGVDKVSLEFNRAFIHFENPQKESLIGNVLQKLNLLNLLEKSQDGMTVGQFMPGPSWYVFNGKKYGEGDFYYDKNWKFEIDLSSLKRQPCTCREVDVRKKVVFSIGELEVEKVLLYSKSYGVLFSNTPFSMILDRDTPDHPHCFMGLKLYEGNHFIEGMCNGSLINRENGTDSKPFVYFDCERFDEKDLPRNETDMLKALMLWGNPSRGEIEEFARKGKEAPNSVDFRVLEVKDIS